MEIKSPADFVRMTRAVLAATGFVRRTAGESVYWEAPGPTPGASAVVLVHGVNDQAGSWFTIAPALAARHRVLIPDLAGHGESAPSSGPLPFPLILEQLDAVIGDEQDFTLVGNSLGGWVATLYALAHPDRVRHLVLEAAGGLARPMTSPVFATNRDEALIILRNVHGPAFEAPEWTIDALLERSVDSPMLRIVDAAPYVLDERLGALRVPTTLIWGADDGVVPLSYAEELCALIDGARLHVIPGAAHIPHLQQAERFLQCLTATF